MNRGSGLIGGKRRAPRAASMRPRFMNRGSAVLDPVDTGVAVASMRPRFMNRGSTYRAASTAARKAMLQ